MKLSLVFTLSAAYMAAIGVVTLVSPTTMSFGLLDSSASADLLLMLRMPGSMAVGIAVLNWLSRHVEASSARTAVVTANVVGFGIAGLLSLWGTINGAPTNVFGMAVLNLVFAVGFLVAGRPRSK